jgi:hypothetical protein
MRIDDHLKRRGPYTRGQQRPHLRGAGIIMNTNAEKSITTSPLADVRQAPLGQLSAVETLDRLRPAGTTKVAVAAFNASL